MLINKEAVSNNICGGTFVRDASIWENLYCTKAYMRSQGNKQPCVDAIRIYEKHKHLHWELAS